MGIEGRGKNLGEQTGKSPQGSEAKGEGAEVHFELVFGSKACSPAGVCGCQ